MISSMALVARRRSLGAPRVVAGRLLLGSDSRIWSSSSDVATVSEALGRGRISPSSASLHTVSSLFYGRDDDKETQRRSRLRQYGLPRINVVVSCCFSQQPTTTSVWAAQQQTRGVTTTTATTPSSIITPGSKQVHSASLSSSSSSPDGSDSSDDNQPNNNKNLRELYEDHTARLRMRAGAMRDNARESWGTFKEHPGASMKSGAMSFGGMMKKYGPIFFGVHISVYFATLGALFVGIDSGSLDPVNLMTMLGQGGSDPASETKNTVDFVTDWMRNHTWTENMAPYVEKNPHMANLAVAWIIVKFTEPLRLPISFFFTPRVARYLGKAPPEEEEDSPADGNPNDTSNTNTTTTLK